MLNRSLARWLGRRTCDWQVARGFNPRPVRFHASYGLASLRGC